MESGFRARRAQVLLVLLLVLAFVAASCGGNDDDPGGGGDASGDSTPGGGGDDEVPSDEGDPVAGGRLVYGIEADTGNPWAPANINAVPASYPILLSIYDPLVVIDENGDYEPYLLESIEPNDDFTQWTLTPREGVLFHDGTSFDAPAIKTNLDAHLNSGLTAKAIQIVDESGTPTAGIQSIELNEDQTAVVITMVDSWTTFPNYLGATVGMMASPTWLEEVAANPDAALQPVGTGPFVYESYEAGGSFVATKNPDYWRTDDAGNQYPYLDTVEFRVLADVQSRQNALLSGQIDIMHTSNGDTISRLQDEDGIELFVQDQYTDQAYILLHAGREDSPVSDTRVRRAMAAALDQEVLIERRGGGIFSPINGPFGPEQIGYLEDNGYPEFDPEEATRLLDEYKADMGIDGTVEIDLTTTSDPFNLGTAELIKQFWDRVGFSTNLAQIEQSQYVIAALTGDFEAFQWRNHNGLNPDNQRLWWHSETADPPPGLALNFGRIRDDEIDSALEAIRKSTDEDEIRSSAEAINQRFGEEAYNIWLWHYSWGYGYQPSVKGITSFTTLDGQPIVTGSAGFHPTVQLWKSE